MHGGITLLLIPLEIVPLLHEASEMKCCFRGRRLGLKPQSLPPLDNSQTVLVLAMCPCSKWFISISWRRGGWRKAIWKRGCGQKLLGIPSAALRRWMRGRFGCDRRETACRESAQLPSACVSSLAAAVSSVSAVSCSSPASGQIDG